MRTGLPARSSIFFVSIGRLNGASGLISNLMSSNVMSIGAAGLPVAMAGAAVGSAEASSVAAGAALVDVACAVAAGEAAALETDVAGASTVRFSSSRAVWAACEAGFGPDGETAPENERSLHPPARGKLANAAKSAQDASLSLIADNPRRVDTQRRTGHL